MFWKTYFWILILVYLVTVSTRTVALVQFNGPIAYVGLFLYFATVVIAIVGVGCYAFRKRLFVSPVWKTLFVLILLVNIVHPLYDLLFDSQEAFDVGYIPGAIAIGIFILTLPQYVAIYLYAWRSPALWK